MRVRAMLPHVERARELAFATHPSNQLKHLARRATMGLARTGSTSGNGSGDIFVAFSIANPGTAKTTGVQDLKMLANDQMNYLFTASAEATEEAIRQRNGRRTNHDRISGPSGARPAP